MSFLTGPLIYEVTGNDNDIRFLFLNPSDMRYQPFAVKGRSHMRIGQQCHAEGSDRFCRGHGVVRLPDMIGLDKADCQIKDGNKDGSRAT